MNIHLKICELNTFFLYIHWNLLNYNILTIFQNVQHIFVIRYKFSFRYVYINNNNKKKNKQTKNNTAKKKYTFFFSDSH